MRFRQLVFRTTPHFLVEWLDGELEKRNIDCVYTHCILSILQEDSDSDDTESDECIDIKKNQQKVYHKYGGPEIAFSANKSKHQKWKTYDKQILLATSTSSCASGISNTEKKKKIAAINCLKSVSDDNTVEELIDELCLKLKNIRNMDAPEKPDPLKKNLNIIDKDTAFFIPPSSPTDQVEKYFAAFPPLDKKVEENIDSRNIDQVAEQLSAWYSNIIKKNKSKNVVQDLFRKRNLNPFQNSEIPKYKQDSSDGSLKSIENIYQPKIHNGKQFKISSPSKNDKNGKFSDENGNSQLTVNNTSKVDTNLATLSKNTKKVKNCKAIKVNTEIHKCNSDALKFKVVKSASYALLSDHKKAKSSTLGDITSNRFSVLMEEESSKIASDLGKMDTENSLKYDSLELSGKVITVESQ